MTRLDRYELPTRFLERFRPVKTQGREKGLPAYLFDAYGLTFYRQGATAGAIPAEAIWSLIRTDAGLRLVHGMLHDATAYVIAQSCPADGDPAAYALPVRLGYRAKVAVQALQRLRQDIDDLPDAAQLVALIDRRIDAYHYPAS
jgi:hypothetical protein